MNATHSEKNRKKRKEGHESNEVKEEGIQTQEASRGVNCPKIKQKQDPHRTHLYIAES